MPKCSFLGAVYNNELYIADAIESILNQTEQDIELVYIDDGSTDGTADILDYYEQKDPRIVVYHMPENVGISKCWNQGLRLITSPYICVISGDDVYFTKRAELTIQNLKGIDNGVFYGGYIRANERLQPMSGTLADGSDARKFTPEAYVTGCLAKKQTIPHGFMSLTTDLAKKVLMREDLRVGVDYPFLVDLEKYGAKFIHTTETLGIYRFHKKMVSNTRRQEVDASTRIAGGKAELSYGL